MVSVSPNRGACLHWQRGLNGEGGGYPALWCSYVSWPAEEQVAGWYEGQLAQTPHPLSVAESHGATCGVPLL